MDIANYMNDVVEAMRRESEAIRRDFAQHRPSAGDGREDLVIKFLKDYLPKRFGVSTGFIISHDGKFSNQADIVIVDKQNNSPFHQDKRNKLWPIEAVYALIEVKTKLNKNVLRDAIAKGRKFKSLDPKYFSTGTTQNFKESLFVIWAFESPKLKTQIQNISQVLQGVPQSEMPDFIIVPDCFVAQAGHPLELSQIGQPSSPRHRHLDSELHYGPSVLNPLTEPFQVYDFGANSLLAWYIWFDSWLRQAGSRFTNPIDYLPEKYTFGKKN